MRKSFLTSLLLIFNLTPVHSETMEDRYSVCMSLASSAPDRGINMALEWQLEEGGIPARHCEAVGLFHDGEYKEAAARLEAIAEDMRLGKDMPVIDNKRRVADGVMLADMWGQAANAWLLAGALIDAEMALETAMSFIDKKDGPHYRQLQFDQARVAAAARDFPLAYKLLDNIAKAEPARRDILLFLASAARQSGRLMEAGEALGRYLETFPGDAAAYLELGNLRFAEGRKDEARKAWLKTIQLDADGLLAETAQENIAKLDLRAD